MSYQPARLSRLAGRYDNPIPESTLSPIQGLWIWHGYRPVVPDPPQSEKRDPDKTGPACLYHIRPPFSYLPPICKVMRSRDEIICRRRCALPWSIYCRRGMPTAQSTKTISSPPMSDPWDLWPGRRISKDGQAFSSVVWDRRHQSSTKITIMVFLPFLSYSFC